MLDAVREIYRRSLKPTDSLWNNWVSRPPAAVVVWALRGSRVTPNQVTFGSLTLFAVAATVMIAWPTHLGLIATALLIQSSYILDCVDGQLARYKNLASPVGALLDFLVDEIKAFLLVGAGAVRMWRTSGEVGWLVVAVGGLFVVATGITLTTFMRRREYLEATGAAPRTDGEGSPPKRSSPPIAAIEWIGRFVIQYPSYVWLLCLLDRLDLFLEVYLGAHVLYLGRASLTILLKLGRPLGRSS